MNLSILLSILGASAITAEPPRGAPPTTFSGLAAKYTVTSSLGSVESDYTKRLCALAETWPKDATFANDAGGAGKPALVGECYATPGNPTYMGVGQRMTIDTSFERARAVVDDYVGYVGIFDGLVGIKPLAADGNRVESEWEEAIPFPFVPNSRNRMIDLVNQVDPNLKIYRYGLARVGTLKRDDGLIVLEREGPSRTRYTEYDFFDADWGLAKSFGVERLWKESVEGIFQSDLALKLKAEHGDWSSRRILEESRKLAKTMTDDKAYCPRKIFSVPAPGETSKCR